ncbi:MAG: hypothetical protein ACI92I_000156 [Acidimicrobiales bacterium]|jgi:hypothetical protein
MHRPIDAKGFFESLIETPAKSGLELLRTRDSRGEIRIKMAALAQIARRHFQAENGIAISGIDYAISRKGVDITISGPIHHWAINPANVPRREGSLSFVLLPNNALGLTAQFTMLQVKTCFAKMFSANVVDLCWETKSLRLFFRHLKKDLTIPCTETQEIVRAVASRLGENTQARRAWLNADVMPPLGIRGRVPGQSIADHYAAHCSDVAEALMGHIPRMPEFATSG